MAQTPALEHHETSQVRFASSPAEALLDAGTRLRTTMFLLAVVALNYTWSRPSPVDFLFFAALLLTIFSRQRINLQNLVLFCLVLAWLLSLYISSISLIDKPNVGFEIIVLTSVVEIGITSCLVATGWTERDLKRFIIVYVIAVDIAAGIGIFGFFTHDPDLARVDGRASAFLDDPDMFGAFLIPGVVGSLFMIAEKRGRFFFSVSLLLLSVGLVLSFSRVAIGSAILWGGVAFLFFNRRNLLKASLAAVAILVPLGLALVILYFSNEKFAEILAERSTLAAPYDVGYYGRYNRYFLAIPLIVDHPFGLGLLQIDKYLPEGIHDIWMGSFLYYGWLGGFAWTLLMVLSVQQAWYTWRRSRSSMYLLILFSWLSVISCAMLQESERWRFLWMFTGILWGLNYRNFPVASQDVAADVDRIAYRNAA